MKSKLNAVQLNYLTSYTTTGYLIAVNINIYYTFLLSGECTLTISLNEIVPAKRAIRHPVSRIGKNAHLCRKRLFLIPIVGKNRLTLNAIETEV